MGQTIFYCGDLERIGLWDTGNCCDSCHDDHNQGYDPYMLEVDLPEIAAFVRVCCRVDRTSLPPAFVLGRALATLRDKEGR